MISKKLLRAWSIVIDDDDSEVSEVVFQFNGKRKKATNGKQFEKYASAGGEVLKIKKTKAPAS